MSDAIHSPRSVRFTSALVSKFLARASAAALSNWSGRARCIRRECAVAHAIAYLDLAQNVGYRVNSLRATQFRQWATGVLRELPTSWLAVNASAFHPVRMPPG